MGASVHEINETYRILIVGLLTLLFCTSMAVKAFGGQDDADAVRRHRRAAEQGDAYSQFKLGLLYFRGEGGVQQDYAEAVKWYRKAAEQGNIDAQMALAGMYDQGYGVPQYYTEAAKWYLKAAEQGWGRAQCRIGTFYELGWGVPQDYAKAAKWYREAADEEVWFGQIALGNMYEKGLGVPRNYIMAHMWYNLAATSIAKMRGVNAEYVAVVLEEAQGRRDGVARHMTSVQIAEAQRLAGEWKPKKE